MTETGIRKFLYKDSRERKALAEQHGENLPLELQGLNDEWELLTEEALDKVDSVETHILNVETAEQRLHSVLDAIQDPDAVRTSEEREAMQTEQRVAELNLQIAGKAMRDAKAFAKKVTTCVWTEMKRNWATDNPPVKKSYLSACSIDGYVYPFRCSDPEVAYARVRCAARMIRELWTEFGAEAVVTAKECEPGPDSNERKRKRADESEPGGSGGEGAGGLGGE